MGLDVSHGCWHGAYSAFHRWRTHLCVVAGLPPLMLMEGFYDASKGLANAQILRINLDRPGAFRLVCDGDIKLDYDIAACLPIRWEVLACDDALKQLLNHSDCEGELPHALCAPLAKELRRLAKLMEDKGTDGHIVDGMKATTLRFADGLMSAHEADEGVRFG